MKLPVLSVCAAIVALPATTYAQSIADIIEPQAGRAWFVSAKGDNKAEGTKEAPLKNLDKALDRAAAGDTIAVAEGTYRGTFDVGLWEIGKDVKLYGGFSADFSARNPVKHVTLLQPDAARFDKSGVKPMIYLKDNFTTKELVFDGFVVDQGQMTPYTNEGKPAGVETGMMKTGPGSKNPDATCLRLKGVNITVRNNVFVNCENSAISIMVNDKSKAVVENNVIVGARMTGITAWGQRGKPGEISIKNNTIVFTWSRQKDLGDQGYGIDVQSDLKFSVENNILALNIGPGVNSQRFNKELSMKNNVFWGNKKKDLWFNPKSNTSIMIDATQFGDLEFETSGNENKALKLPLDGAYTEGVINVQYTEKVDYDENSQANQMRELFGLNKRGTIDSKASMFANRYPWKRALELVGAVPGVGAQTLK